MMCNIEIVLAVINDFDCDIVSEIQHHPQIRLLVIVYDEYVTCMPTYTLTQSFQLC